MARRRKYRRRGLNWWVIVAAALALSWLALLRLQEEIALPFRVPGYEDVRGAVEKLYGGGTPSPAGPPQPAGAAALAVPPGEAFQLQMLDVGQGLAVFLRAPTGECALVDAGDRDAERAVTDALRAQGVGRLDYLIATHAHADHIGGMAGVAEAFDIGAVILSPLPEALQPDTKAYTDLLRAIAAKGKKITLAQVGDTYALGAAVLEIEGPAGEYDTLNNTSVVLNIRYGDTGFLVTGDAEEEAENGMLAARRPLAANVLIAGHHGSATSSGAAFLRAVNPALVGVSCGAGNRYGHPHQEALARFAAQGAAVLRTDLNGSVAFYSDGAAISVQTQR